MNESRYISLKKSKDDEIIELLFQCVVATDVKKRLKRLLRRNMFKEAENLAILENLDVNIVSKAKAKLITEKLKITKGDIDTLIHIFQSLDDPLFIINCCLTAENSCEQGEDLLRILKYACDLHVSPVMLFFFIIDNEI